MKTPGLITIVALNLRFWDAGSSLRADVISDWNRIAHDYITQNAPAQDPRGKTMVHVAQFDAVNAIMGGYTPYALALSAPGASPEAAAAQAAYTVLTNISRAGLSKLNDALANSLSTVPNGPSREDGLRVGLLAANLVIQLRAADNVDLKISAPTSTVPGRWRKTPPSFQAGVGAELSYLVPWTARSVSQFRPGPPPELHSTLYADDLNEVRLRGERNSSTRTSDQTLGAIFHNAVGDQEYLAAILSKRALPLVESARLFALYYMVLSDALTSVYEAKYVYNFWRPITAIRLADTDGNDATQPDPNWNSYIDTHPHPEYPSAACQITAATIEVLIDALGDDFPVSVSTSASSTPRVFPHLSAAVEDVIEGRISAGMHFRNSCKVAVATGRTIARNALANYLRPIPRLSIPSGPTGLQLNIGTGSNHRRVRRPHALAAKADQRFPLGSI